MNTYTAKRPHIDGRSYETCFWDTMRGKIPRDNAMEKGVDPASGAFVLMPKVQSRFQAELEKESVFRNIATAVRAYDSQCRIKTAGNDELAVWVAEGGMIPIDSGAEDFGDQELSGHKLATFFKLDEGFVKDNTFLLEDYLVKRLAKNFGRAEDNAFINGTGEDMPTGILADNGGAEIGVTTAALTYDDVVNLFLSVKAKYRRKGIWLVNDETAIALRKLKDADGNSIWNHTNDTILGHKVVISEFMPGIDSGNKPIAFGDFSYYWIVNRSPVSIRTLRETFALIGHIGYLAFEFLDGKLTRPEAIKVLKIAE